jgi:hypothetical protein
MTSNRDAAASGPERHVIRSTLLAVLTMAAMLLCLLAVHSSGAGHEMNHALPAAASHAAMDTDAQAPTLAGATMTAVARIDAGSLSYGNSMGGAALLAMTCAVLLVLSALVLLARRPSVHHRLVDAVPFVVDSFRAIPLHLHRPSLTLLSISRV